MRKSLYQRNRTFNTFKNIKNKTKKNSQNLHENRKIRPKFLNWPIHESLFSRKLILALGDSESLNPRETYISVKVCLKIKCLQYIIFKVLTLKAEKKTHSQFSPPIN